MAADHHLRLGMPGARQDGDDVPQVDVLKDALPLLLHAILIEADLEARAVALELVVDPGARGADTLCLIVLVRHRVARSERLELGQDVVDAGFRHLLDHSWILGFTVFGSAGYKDGA